MNLIQKIKSVLEEEARTIKIMSVDWPDTKIEKDQKLLGIASEKSIQLLGLVQILDERASNLKQNLDNSIMKKDRLNIEKELVITNGLTDMAATLFSSAITEEFLEKLERNEKIGLAENFQIFSFSPPAPKNYIAIDVKDAIKSAVEKMCKHKPKRYL